MPESDGWRTSGCRIRCGAILAMLGLSAWAADQAGGLVGRLRQRGLADAAVIGDVLAEPQGRIVLV